MKNKKIANINVTLKSLFFKWLDITSSFHNLKKQEKDILALLLYYHYIYSKDITNNKILWKIVFDYETKLKIRKELNIKDPSIQNALTSMRKKNIIKNNKIVDTYIPNISQDANNFKIIFNFNIIK